MKRGRVLPRLREAAAMVKQARYLSRDLAPQADQGEGPVVVLLHGLYASAGVFRPLRARLKKEFDASIFSFSYAPGPGIETLSSRLEKLVATITLNRPVHLVGHSLGGVVMRHYASSPHCDSRVVQTISLAAPFLGSDKNWLVPGQAGRDIAPGSHHLARLVRSMPENEKVPHLTIVAGEDELIIPGAYPEYGRHLLVPRVGHNGILFHDESIEHVVNAIRTAEPG